MRRKSKSLNVQKQKTGPPKSVKTKAADQKTMRSKWSCCLLFSHPDQLYPRRLRGSRNKRGETDSEKSEEHSDSENSDDIGDHTSDSVDARSSPSSDDENRRPERDARTRAKVTVLLSSLSFVLTSGPGKN